MSVYVKVTDPLLAEEFPHSSIYTTLEGENPSGSIKDHMIEKGLRDLLEKELLKPGGDIAEISAGSSALSLAYFSQRKGLNCHLFLPEDVSLELKNRLREMEAKLYLVKKENAYQEYKSFLAQSSILPFDQMFDSGKSVYYENIGIELKHVAPEKIDAVIGAVGTGHSLAGIAKGVSTCSNDVATITAEPCAGMEISGVRNIVEQSMGAEDPCRDRFDDRIIVEKDELWKKSSLLTDQGAIRIGTSFQLTLSAVRKFLQKKPASSVFAVGANNKRK